MPGKGNSRRVRSRLDQHELPRFVPLSEMAGDRRSRRVSSAIDVHRRLNTRPADGTRTGVVGKNRVTSGKRAALWKDGPAVVAMAQRLERRSAYDAAYVVLAEQLGADLWTLDGPLARNASSRGLPVRLIETSEPRSESGRDAPAVEDS
jgi:hypothetical protein